MGFLDCQFSIMKIRVMSKLGVREPQAYYFDNSRNSQRNILPMAQTSMNGTPHSDYFPQAASLLPKERLQPNKGSRIAEFFNNFQTRCSIHHEPVEWNFPHLNRKLTPLLQAMEKTQPVKTPMKDDYQFSFKKQDTTSSPRNHLECHLPIPTPHAQRNGFAYYLQSSNRPKIKLRKFNSLISIKNNYPTTSTAFPEQTHPVIRRNLSIAKKETSLVRFSQVRRSQERNHTENEEEREVLLGQKMRESVKTEGFEEEKQRLARIRRELNQIYNAKKGPSEIRLKLY